MAKENDKLDILFIHTPKFNDRLHPLGEVMFINIIPSGVFALADFLKKNGVRAGILHLGVEWILRGRFDPIEYIEKHRPRAVAFSLHWHHQSYDVISVAGKIRERFPDIVIILGGLTASYFAGEILRKYPFIDYIISGDSEIPLLNLMNHILKGESSISKIPNLYHREENKVMPPVSRYITSPDLFNSLEYHNYDLLIDGDFYRLHMGIPAIWVKDRDFDFHRRELDPITNVYFPVTGKGCPHTCTWCGKERRHSSLRRDPSVVASAIKKAEEKGFGSLYFAYDTYPDSDDYHIEIFERLRKLNVNMFAYFENWALPSERFIRDFRRKFHDGVIALSPDAGAEDVRKLNKGLFYSNERFFETMDLLKKYDVETDIFLSFGMPGENEDKFRETLRFIEKCRKNYDNVGEICLFGLELEPGSPWFEKPEKYGIITGRKNFADFYKAHSPGGRGSFASLGYYIPKYFNDERKCRDVDSFERAMGRLKSGIGWFEDENI